MTKRHRIRPWWIIRTVATVVAVVAVPWLLIQTVLAPTLRLARIRAEPSPTFLRVPVSGVRVQRLVDTWGGIRSGNRRHEGIDIFAPRGTAIIAATYGMVSMVGQNPLGGNVVWIAGPGGERHYYAHLDAFAPISEGAEVMIGDTLGYVGDTGNARGTPTHLHYGIYTDSGAINPYPKLMPPWRRPRAAGP